MDFKVNEETINKIVNYLATRPFIEVHQLISVLQKVEKIEDGDNGQDSKSSTDS